MNDRLFEIDSDANLNALYLLAFLLEYKSNTNIKTLMVALFLIKYPTFCLSLLEKNHRRAYESKLEVWEIDNLENKMLRYVSTTYDEGFNNGMAFLYSRNIIIYGLDDDSICLGDCAKSIDIRLIPQKLKVKAKYAYMVISKKDIAELEDEIHGFRGV